MHLTMESTYFSLIKTSKHERILLNFDKILYTAFMIKGENYLKIRFIFHVEIPGHFVFVNFFGIGFVPFAINIILRNVD